jgi:hypothetical protein
MNRRKHRIENRENRENRRIGEQENRRTGNCITMGNGKSLGKWKCDALWRSFEFSTYQLPIKTIYVEVTTKNNKFILLMWEEDESLPGLIGSRKKIFDICDKITEIKEIIPEITLAGIQLECAVIKDNIVKSSIIIVINNHNKSLIREKLEKKIRSSGVISIIIDYIFAEKEEENEQETEIIFSIPNDYIYKN